MTWIVTGGAGYIGAHVVHLLRARGHEMVVFDNMSTGIRERVPAGVPVERGSVSDPVALARLFDDHPADGVIHLAARKSAVDSVREPDLYAGTNVLGTKLLLAAMRRAGVGRLLFASSAAVYGDSGDRPAAEDRDPRPVNPYGETKCAAERLVAGATGSFLRAITFRQFNVVGAGTHPRAMDTMATTLLPAVFTALTGGPALEVRGRYERTSDGTAMRDYVHVEDIAEAYARGVGELTGTGPAYQVINLGRGTGTSILQLVELVERVTGRPVPYRLGEARKGDAAQSVADTTRAVSRGYACARPLIDAIRTAWPYAG